MKLPSQKKILREDLKDAPEWVQGIIVPVNSFMETTYQALNKNITFTENINSFIKEITYTTPSTYPTGVTNVTIRNELKSKVMGVSVSQVYDKETYAPAAGPVYVPWVQDSAGDIIIYPITGLEVSTTYLVRLLIY